ncbi:MAG: S-methyl-5'-thioadenosine phosphorylase [Dehalococcoidia bacterium]|nr:S-methyl-5'-thioadenosine phosphorylase [Dehalococcoidia bacterium]
MAEARVAIIGGSGLYQMDGLSNVKEVSPDTPFGRPSDAILLGEMRGVPVAFLPRHGRGHRISPTELPVRANIYALKTLGVERVVSISAVGSLKEEVHPLDLVVPDQLIDRTRQRANTFFGDGLVAHISFADPFCPDLSAALADTAAEVGATVHRGGTYVVMEGPAFSTRAESFLYRSWGASVIGMTALPEAKLAREAEMCYAILACATDYDCWHETEEAVSVEMVIANLSKNVATSKEIVRRLLTRLSPERTCACASALKSAMITDRSAIPAATKKRLAPLIGKYM